MGQDRRTVVVTGAGRGLGRAIARRLAADGWRLVVTGRRERDLAALCEELNAEAGEDRHLRRRLDVAELGGMRAVADEIAELHGLDAWVNNAGVSKISRFVDVTAEDFDRLMAVNLRGAFFGTQYAARAMLARGTRGSIVNVASLASMHAVDFLSDYSASKFGVVGLTQAAARELGPEGIRVNAVCPGFVDTDMQSSEESQLHALTGRSPEELRREVAAQSPQGTLQPESAIAAAVAFLLSDDAGFITGESMAVNGGASMD